MFTGTARFWCEIGDIPSGASEVVFIGVWVPATTADGVALNRVSAWSSQHDTNPSDNEVNEGTTVVAQGYIGPVLVHPEVEDHVVGGLPFGVLPLALDLPLILGDESVEATSDDGTQTLMGAQYDVLYDPTKMVFAAARVIAGVADCIWEANPQTPGVGSHLRARRVAAAPRWTSWG